MLVPERDTRPDVAYCIVVVNVPQAIAFNECNFTHVQTTLLRYILEHMLYVSDGYAACGMRIASITVI